MTIQLDVMELPEPLVEGEEPEKMASLEHGIMGMKLGSYLLGYVLQNKLGLVFDGQTSFRMIGTPRNRQPDVAFVAASRLPADLRIKADFAPDLAVEIVSESDVIFELEHKVLQYQESGVRMVWVIYPVRQLVEVYRLATGYIPQIVSLNGELDGEDVIPGFKLAVKSLFE